MRAFTWSLGTPVENRVEAQVLLCREPVVKGRLLKDDAATGTSGSATCVEALGA